MSRLLWLKIKIMRVLGYVPVEHVLHSARYAPIEGGLFFTLKHIVVTEIEFFRKGTRRETVDYYNMAFARQKIGIFDLYSYRTQWSWRIIEE